MQHILNKAKVQNVGSNVDKHVCIENIMLSSDYAALMAQNAPLRLPWLS